MEQAAVMVWGEGGRREGEDGALLRCLNPNSSYHFLNLDKYKIGRKLENRLKQIISLNEQPASFYNITDNKRHTQ